MTLADNGTGYWWRVKTIDELDAESAYSDAVVAATADFRVDTTPPSAGTVLDGTGADINFNDGLLHVMSANWSGFTDALSGVASYQYSIGTSPGAADTKFWASVGTSTAATANTLVLHTSQTYYFNVRATDVAGNQMTTPASSDGQAVLPTFTVTVGGTSVELGNFSSDNSFTGTTTVTVTVSTNAYNGFVVKMFASDSLRSVENLFVIIPDFSAGTYSSPAVWSGTGWGFNTDDCDINGGAFWTGANCSGEAKYAPVTQVGPGDVVADHTNQITGLTGPVSNKDFIMRLRAATTSTQEHATYRTNLVFAVVPQF